MPAKELIRRYRQFRGKTGSVGRDAQVSASLARAVVHATTKGWEWSWEDDPEGWPKGGVCSCECGAEIKRCEGCVLRDAEGNVLASLWSIWDADADYRRVVEAELAWEAMQGG